MIDKKLSKELIDAGLTQILISIQGVTTESYKKVCQYDMDINKLVENIRFFTIIQRLRKEGVIFI